ncbi:MAG: cytochrome c class [Devosia sp.]|nr:cytochrome c class [Devosia sp.]
MKRIAIVMVLALGISACEREDRETRPDPAVSGMEPKVTLSSIIPGGGSPPPPSGLAGQYEGNAYHVSQGKKYYTWFNCNGCHANGGGDSGPPLMDDTWIYGGDLEEIVSTIYEGRPNGMPSFRGKLTDEQIWQIAAFVRSLGNNVPSDAASGRNDDLNPHPPEGQLESQPPIDGGTAPPSGQMPQ